MGASQLPPRSEGGRITQKSWDEEADIRVMVGHGEPRTTALSVIKSAPAVSKIDVTFQNGTATGLGGGATAKRTTDAIFIVHRSVKRDKLRVLLLDEVKFVENVQFIVPGEAW
jgi:hypothetical protein